MHPPASEKSTIEQTRKYTLILRVFVVFLLIAVAVVCGFIANSIITKLEREKGEQHYESVAETALTGARSIALRRHDANEAMASIMANAFPDAEQWPYVALNGYESTATMIARLHNSQFHAFLPVVLPDQVEQFNAFAKQVYKQRRVEPGAGVNTQAFGIWDFATYSSNITKVPVKIDENSTYFTPSFLGSHDPAQYAMFNAASSPYSGAAFHNMMACAADTKNRVKHCSASTDMIPLFNRNSDGPLAVFYSPVLLPNNTERIFGFLSTDFKFMKLLEDVGE